MDSPCTASARGLLDCDLNYRPRNNGAKLIEKHFYTHHAVAQHFYPFKIKTTWNALTVEAVTIRR